MDNEFVKFRVAVATSDGIVVNQHYGRADRFQIYDIYQDNTFRLLETRESEPVCQGGNHDDAKMQEKCQSLFDCRYVLVSRIGQGAAYALEQEGVNPMELPGMIEESIGRLVAYDEVQSLLA